MANGNGFIAEQAGKPRPFGTTNSKVFILEDTTASMAANEVATMMTVPKGTKIVDAQIFGTTAAVDVGWTAGINKPLSGNTDGVGTEAANGNGIIDGSAALSLRAPATRKVFAEDVRITLTAPSAIATAVTLRLFCVNT